MPDLFLFTDDGATEATVVGGKGANLSLLTAAGFPVPPGFIVGADAYLRFFADTGLQPEIDTLLTDIDYQDPEALERSSAAMRAAVSSRQLPAELADQITTAYAALGDSPYVAVRSSGTKEDGAAASYAGLHDTF